MIIAARNTRGFSLIELMGSMAIGSVILLAAAALLGVSGDGYERVGGGVATERQARAVIAQLASDLSTATYHQNGVIEKSSESWPADRIGFLSLQPALAQSEAGRIGDLCTVSYYLKDLTINGKTVRCLMRGFHESADTFKALEGGKVSLLFAEQPNIDEPVAFGVVSFEARPKSRDQAGRWVDWVKNDNSPPMAIDVRLVIARRGLAAKLKLPADWDGEGTSGRLLGTPGEVERNEDLEVFGTLIRFGNDENA